MSDLDLLIQSADNLCNSLAKAAENEKKFCQTLCIELERCSWEILRMTNDIRELKERYGEYYVPGRT